MTSRRSILLSLMLGAFLSVMGLQTANAQVPRSISYQGRLIKAGQPVNGTVNLTIKIYDASGAEKYTETSSLVEVKDGIFNVLLGGTSGTLPATLDFNEQYFLGINVDGTGEMNPRTPFVASPYALNAELVGGVGVAKVPTPGMLLPLDQNGKLPISVLPQVNGEVQLNGINLFGGPDSATNIVNLDGSVVIVNDVPGRRIILSAPSTSAITAVQAGPGLSGGGSSGVVSLQIANNGITPGMIGTGAVLGRNLDQMISGDGLYQDVLGNLNVGVNSTLLAFPDLIGLNLANPNTWTALQTFNAGITVNGTTTLNGPVNITGLITHIGNTNQTGNYNLTGNLVVTGTSDLQGNIFNSSTTNGGSVTIQDSLRINGNVTHVGTYLLQGDEVQFGNWTGTGTWTHTGNMGNTGNFTQTGILTNNGNGIFNLNSGSGNNVTINGAFGMAEPNVANAAAVTNYEFILNNGDARIFGATNLIGNTFLNQNLAVGGNTAMTGTLNVSGLTTLTGLVNNGPLTQNGASTFTGAITQSGGNVTLGGATTINNTLNVNGATTLNGNLTVTGLSDLQGAISNSTANNLGDVTVNDGFRVNGNTTQNGNFTQTSGSTSLLNTTVTGTLTQSGGNATINGGATNVFGSVAGSSNTIGAAGSNNTVTGATNTLTASGNTAINTGGNLTVNTTGNNNISGANNNITGPTNITGNTAITGNLSTTGNNTLGTAGVSTNLIQGTNNTVTSSSATTINGTNVNVNGVTTITGATQINGTLGTTGNMTLGTASTSNVYGGTASANRFNGTSNFGTLPAGNGNKVIVDGIPNTNPINIVPGPGFGLPTGFIDPTDYELIVNGDAKITGYTNLNNAYVNNLVIGVSLFFPPGATLCAQNIQVQNLGSWCSTPNAAINLQTAFTQSSLGSSANNTFLASTFNGNVTVNGNETVTGTETTGNIVNLGTLDQRGNIFNTVGNVTVNDIFEVLAPNNSIFGGPATFNSSISQLAGQNTTLGNLSVQGTTNLVGATTSNGITNTGNIATTTLNTTGLATLNSLLVNTTSTFTGVATFNGIVNSGTLTQNGISTFGAAAQFNSSINQTAGQNSTLGNLNVQGTTNLTGATTSNGITNTGNIGTTTLTTTSTANIGGALTVAGTSTLNGATSINNTLNVTGVTTTNGITNTGNIGTTTLSTTGLATLNSASVTNNLTVGGTTQLNILNVSGLTSTNGISNTGNITNSAQLTTNTLVVNSTSSFAGLATFNGILNNGGLDQRGVISNGAGNVTLTDNFDVTGNTSFAGNITQTSGSTTLLTTATGNLTVTGTLTQSGGNAAIAGGATNSFGTVAASNNTIGSTTSTNLVNGTSNTLGTQSAGNTVINAIGNASQPPVATALGATVVPALNNQIASPSKNNMTAHNVFTGAAGVADENIIYVDGTPSVTVPGDYATLDPLNGVVGNYEVIIHGDVLIDGHLTSRSIPWVRSARGQLRYDGTLGDPVDGYSSVVIPVTGLLATDNVTVTYITDNPGSSRSFLDAVAGAGSVTIRSSSPTDDNTVQIVIHRPTP